MTKTYDAKLDEQCKPAEWAMLSWLMDAGFTVTDHPQGACGPDIHIARLAKVNEEFIVEVELMEVPGSRPRTDESGFLLYDTLSVLARRKVSATLPTLICQVTGDLRHVFIVFDRDFQAFPTRQCCASANNPAGDDKKYVPVERVLRMQIGSRLDCSIAEINRMRVVDALEATCDLETWRKHLAPVRPYGMTGVEWRRFLDRMNVGDLGIGTNTEMPF